MYNVYTEQKGVDFSKTLVGEFEDFEEAMDCAEKSIEGKDGYRYIVESTSVHFNSYGDLLTEVVAQSD